MANPVALFGEVTEQFTRKVIELRKKVKGLGYDEGERYIYTVPHLTLASTKDFIYEPSEIKKVVLEETVELERFSLNVNNFGALDDNIAAFFDNSFSKKLAVRLGTKLEDGGFHPVVTDHMRIIRSHIKRDHLENVRRMIEGSLPKSIKIVSVALAGKELRQEDILWSVSLN